MVAVQQQIQSTTCVKCGHPIVAERVGTSVVIKSERHGWRRILVFHYEYLTPEPKSS